MNIKSLFGGNTHFLSGTRVMEKVCAQSDCQNTATKSCAACESISYCSATCQKLHWKSHHKERCLKKMTSEFLPVAEVLTKLTGYSEQLLRLMNSGGTIDEQIKSLEHSISFAEHQFGMPSTPGEFYYTVRSDGVKISNLVVAESMSSQYLNLGTRYSNQQSMKSALLAEPYFSKSRSVLEPLRLLLDVVIEDKAMLKLKGERELVLGQLSRTERKLAINCMELNRLKDSDAHCSQSLSFAKRMKEGDENSTTVVIEALLCYGELRSHQYWSDCESTSKGSYDYFAEAYILVSEVHGPVHPQVQDVSAHLIGSLIKLGDFDEAERFARVNYESLTDPTSGADPDGREVMKGAAMLVKICYATARLKGEPLVDFVEGEMLARKVVRIAIRTDGVDGYDAGIYQFDLYLILKEIDRWRKSEMTAIDIKKSIIERKLLLDRALAVTVRCHGDNGKDTMYMHQELHAFYGTLSSSLPQGVEKNEAYKLSQNNHDVALRISFAINGVRHPYTVTLLRQMSMLDILSKMVNFYPNELFALTFVILFLSGPSILSLF